MLIYDSLYLEAADLGVLDNRDVMEGIEVDLRIARALNGVKNDTGTIGRLARHLENSGLPLLSP